MAADDPRAPAESIGVRLRRLRQERGLSQRELAAPGVSYAYISRIEAGTRQPSVKALRKLARNLGVSPEYLETGSEIAATERRELELATAELQLRLEDHSGDAEAALRRVLAEATEAGDGVATVRAQVALGMTAASAGRHDEAISLLSDAIASGTLDPATRPDVYATLGRSYAASGQQAKAVELWDESLAAVREETPEDVAARVRFATYLSYALADLGEFERAEAVVSEAIDSARGLADPYTQIRLYWARARLAGLQERPSVALRYARRALALLEATEDTFHLARAHLLCATAMNAQGKGEEAWPHLEQAEKLLRLHPDVSDLASLRVEQAKASAARGRTDDAIAYAREAIELFEGGDPAEQGDAHFALAGALAASGDATGADEAFRHSVELLSGQARWRDAARVARAWAKMLRDAGRETDALDALEQATDLAVRAGSVGTPGAR